MQTELNLTTHQSEWIQRISLKQDCTYVAVTRSLVRRWSQLQTWLDKSNKLNLQENFFNVKINKGCSQLIILYKELLTRTVVRYTHVLHKIMRTSLSHTIITLPICVCVLRSSKTLSHKITLCFSVPKCITSRDCPVKGGQTGLLPYFTA
jgi:hypothetical protein